MVPLIGARETTVVGGLLVSAVTLMIAWRIPNIARFRWDEGEDRGVSEVFRENKVAD
jgi:hypothetical protein